MLRVEMHVALLTKIRFTFSLNRTNVRLFRTTSLDTPKSWLERFNNKIAGTIIENWLKYWKNVFLDYKGVVIDVKNEIKEKPFKGALYIGTLSTATYLWANKPNENDFRDAFLTHYTRLILVHPSQQKPEAFQHLQNIEHLYNQDLVRSFNAGILTIIYSDKISENCNNYESICPYLQLQYKSLFNNIVDVGILNNWVILSQKMKDYDVNV